YGTGNAAELELNAPEIIFEQGALISATTWNKGQGSNVTIDSTGSVIFRGESIGKCQEGDCRTQINISADDDNMQETGNAGILNIHANEILFENGAFIAGNTHTQANGPKISLIADASLIFEGESRAHKNSSIIMNTYGEGNAGEMDIRGRNIYLYDGALLVSNTGGKGNAGNISLFADEVIELSGEAEEYIVDDDGNYLGQSYSSSAVYASVWTTGQGGDGGSITVETNDLVLKDGAFITTSTFGNGNAGNLSIHAKGKISVEGANSKTGWASWISSASNPKIPGKSGGYGGRLNIKAKELLLLDGGNISTSTIALKEGVTSQDAGEIIIDVSDHITLSGVNPYGETEDGFGSGIYSNTIGIGNSAGKAGNIIINANKLDIKDGAVILSRTTGFSKSGDIHIKIGELDISGDSQSINLKEKKNAQHSFDASNENKTESFSTSGIYQISDPTIDAGNKGTIEAMGDTERAMGNVYMRAHDLTLRDNASIITTTMGFTDGGNIEIDTEDIKLINSLISTNAKKDGKNINIRSKSFYMKESIISSNVSSTEGDGGDISIELYKGILLNSNILTQSIGGKGGNISIQATDYFIKTQNSLIDASSLLDLNGNVFIDSPITTDKISCVDNKSIPFNSFERLPIKCDDRTGDQYNNFFLKTKDAIPTSPKDWLASPPMSFEYSDQLLNIQGESYFRKGLFSEAIEVWKNQTEIDILSIQWIKTLIYLSNAYLEIGYHQKAILTLNRYLPVIKQSDQPYQQSLFYNILGDLYLSLRDLKQAKKFINLAMNFVKQSNNNVAIASVLNHMGNLHATKRRFQKADECYSKALETLASVDESVDIDAFQSKILINKTHTLLQCYDKENFPKEINIALNSELKILSKSQNSYRKVFDMIALSIHIQKISEKFGVKAFISTCNDLLTLATQLATDLKHDRLLSLSYGYMGLLKKYEGRLDEAKQNFRKAIGYSQYHHPDIYYLWQWQIGRIFYEENNAEQAEIAYSLAVDILNPCFQSNDSSTHCAGIIHQLFKGYRSHDDLFNSYVKPLYMEYVEILSKDIPENEKEHRARTIRNIWESMKEVEIQNFFKDECVTAIKSKKKRLDQLPQNTALIYPILLKKNPIVLLSFYNKTILIDINSCTSKDVLFSAVRLRKYLEKDYKNEQYKRPARELYQYLIKPLEHYLKTERINQLVIAADGILQLIPFSSLMKQNQVLSETYAISIVPSITLAQTDRLSINPMDIKAALFGITKGLPIVEEELKDINEIWDSEIFMDQEFNYQNVMSALNHSDNSIVHIATHGSFGDKPDERFLTLYDTSLQLNMLENLIRVRFFKKPLELLTLSACQTALGDAQTALGFAGISIKAGARSVVATLWRIPDSDSTRILMKQFYSNLAQGMTKTSSLQMAKLFLINETIYKHPKYWSPFILIGNWL
ncbi:hypothetical protein MHK_005992, partial [Candidatus Magnetomorum sp. HK-1]